MHGTIAMARPSATPELAGQLCVAEVERRVLRACQTIRALPDQERKFQVYPNLWPEIVQEIADAYGYTEAIIPRFKPTPADVSDCLFALAWFRNIPRREWKIIWWRSFDMSFHQMSLRLGRTPENARKRYRTVLVDLWIVACSQKNA